jgi:hypothetical protein
MTKIDTLISAHRFFIGELPFAIEVRLWRNTESKWIYATASHAIETPEQHCADVPQPGGRRQRSPEDALQAVISGR